MNEENEKLFYDEKDEYEDNDEEKSTYSLHMSLPFQG